MVEKYYTPYKERAESYYYPEITKCKNCGHPVEQLYHNIYRHITDEVAGKECSICGCNNPEPTIKKSVLNPKGLAEFK